MGDRDNPDLEIGATITSEFSNDWSINGNTSLKAVVNVSESTSTSRVGYLSNDTDWNGKTIKASVNVNASNSTWKLEVLYHTTSWSSATSVDIASGESSAYVQLAIPEEATRVWIRLRSSYGPLGTTIYTDNWCVEEV